VEYPDGLRYSEEHEWVRADRNHVVVGITDYAQDALGDVVFVELPSVGMTVSRGERVCEVESTKSVSEIFAPVSGTIQEVNNSLADTPEQLNTDPYGAGWIFTIAATDEAEVDSLMDAAKYRNLVEQ
jgi:glycine cleavage system H protein